MLLLLLLARRTKNRPEHGFRSGLVQDASGLFRGRHDERFAVLAGEHRGGRRVVREGLREEVDCRPRPEREWAMSARSHA